MKRCKAHKKSDSGFSDVEILVAALWRLVDAILIVVEKGLGSIFSPFVKAYRVIYNTKLKKIIAQMNDESNTLRNLMIAIIVLMLVGVMNAYSLKNVVSSPTAPIYKTLFFKHIIYLVTTSILGFIAYKKIPFRAWGSEEALTILSVGVAIGLCSVLAFGDYINGAKRWINLKVMSVQPSEFAKLVAILAAAHYIEYEQKVRKQVRFISIVKAPKWIKKLSNDSIKRMPMLSKALWAGIIFAALTYPQPDFGTAALIVGFPFLLLLISTESKREIIHIMILGCLAIPVIAIREQYRLKRILLLLDPWSAAKDGGYQTVQSIVAVGSGKLWGFNNNLLHFFSSGISKYSYLPEKHTDFAFAIWAQEHGFFGVMIVIIAIASIMYYGFAIGNQSKSTFGTLTAYGLTAMIGLQGIYNMFMVGGFAPVVGVPLPFVSYGGSGMAMNVWAIAIIASIAKETKKRRRLATLEQESRPLIRDEVQSRYRPQ